MSALHFMGKIEYLKRPLKEIYRRKSREEGTFLLKEVMLKISIPFPFFRFHRAAFIFIGNMALADLVLAIVEIIVVQIELGTRDHISQQLLLTPVPDLKEPSQLVKLDQRINQDCR